MESTSISCKNGSAQNLQSKNFVHLHQHTTYSFLDGYNPIKKAVARIKKLGMTAAAITDHNHLAGIPEWKEECEANGIKPLLGYEGYYTEDMGMASLPVEERKIYAYLSALENGDINESCSSLIKGFNIDTFKNDMVKISDNEMKPSEFLKIYKPLFSLVEQYVYDMRQYHILFIAKNQTGWKNLVKIQSESARLCTYNGRYLCDMNLLRKYSDGVICTTACIGSKPARYLEIGREDKAEEYIVNMKEIFSDNFYLEIQPLALDKQIKTNLFYMKMSKKYNIKCIATNDVHYTLKSDHDDHDTLLCIGTGQYKTEEIAHRMWKKSKTRTAEFKYNRMHYSNDFWIKSYNEMIDSFKTQSKDIPDDVLKEYKEFYLKALEGTNYLADEVEAIELGSKTPLFSNFKPPAGYTPERYLTRLAYSGMYKYLSGHPECDVKTYEKRLAEELAVINPKGFAPYMLAVWEYANWANAHGCVTGPGRGSAAGSLVLFSIGITKNIDPIKNKLWFSRFLTADRKDLPDVDLDFSWENRDSVIKHLEDYYGKTKVSHIGTYTTLGVKNGLKDVGRVLGMEFMEMNNISKKIDEISDKPSVSFSDLDALKDGTEGEKTNYLKFFELESKYKELFRLARAFEGIPRNTGVHASGILVTPMDVSDLFPLRYLSDGTAVTLYTGPQLEQNKAVKYDLLGLKTLDIITKALNHINDIKDIEELYKMADITDKKVWNLIREKNTDAVFQIESNMMKGIIESIQPDCFDDLVAINSVGRPGPVSMGLNTKYGNVKNGKAQPEYPIRDCEDILGETYSYPIYQEQLMAISKKVSGFDDSQADSITRKVLAKKKRVLFPMMKRCHIYGKLNIDGPEGWEEDDNAPWYDPKGKYGKEIPGGLVNGYTAEEINNYFDKIEGFASYCLTA